MKKADILVAEDEAIVGLEIEISLKNMGFNVIAVVRTGEKAIEKAGQIHPDIILMDIRLNGRMDGIEAAQEIRDRFDIPIIFLTAYADEEKLKRAGLTMPFGYILKPFTDRDLMVTIRMGLYTAGIHAEQKRTEKLLQKAHDELEQRVKERTEALSLTNRQLRMQMEIRTMAEESLRKTNRELMFLNRMIRKITAGTSFNDVVKLILKGIDEIFKPDTVILFIRKDDCLVPVLKNSQNLYTLSQDSPLVHRVGECLCGLAAEKGIPQYCMDILKDNRCTRGECREKGYRSFGALPLLARGEVIGVLGLGALKHHDFAVQKIFLETLADEIAIGLQNALLVEKLKQQEELFRIASESAGDLIYEWDLETDIMTFFGNIEQMFGYKDSMLEKSHPGDFKPVHPEDRKRVRKLAEFQKQTGKPASLEFRVQKKDGVYGNWSLKGSAAFDEQGKPVRLIGVCTDITEEKKIKASLARADRLASLGQLSGGIAHEIRNPLEGIKLFVDILSDETRYERSEAEQEIFHDINLNIMRINGIIKKVLTFARQDQASMETLNLNDMVLETLKLFDARLRKLNIKKKLILEESLSRVNGDAVALQQILVNLVSNAVDAMDQGGGTLTIETFNSESSFFKGRMVSGIKIKDTGPGIRPEERDKVFNPFYTTKKTGIGLGLAISHQIAERHGGAITFSSEPGQGALFVIELPALN